MMNHRHLQPLEFGQCIIVIFNPVKASPQMSKCLPIMEQIQGHTRCQQCARDKFALLFPLATIVIGKTYTNAYQECCFSLASWFDSKLMQCQKAEMLQMCCLDAQNRKNISRMTQLMVQNGKINLCSKNKKHILSLATKSSDPLTDRTFDGTGGKLPEVLPTCMPPSVQ